MLHIFSINKISANLFDFYCVNLCFLTLTAIIFQLPYFCHDISMLLLMLRKPIEMLSEHLTLGYKSSFFFISAKSVLEEKQISTFQATNILDITVIVVTPQKMKFSIMDLVTFGQKLTQVFTGRNFGATEAVPEVFYKKGVLRNFTNSQENTCAKVSF